MVERLYKKSVDVLKEAQLDNGGCLATPLGERYPYIYPRDHSIIILGFLSAGMDNEAKKALEFIFGCVSCNQGLGAFPQRIDKKGRDGKDVTYSIDFEVSEKPIEKSTPNKPDAGDGK